MRPSGFHFEKTSKSFLHGFLGKEECDLQHLSQGDDYVSHTSIVMDRNAVPRE
jgi:hypothetical protein